MTPDPTLKLDPAVEEILRDIAADPDARLLRAPRSKMLGALTRGELLEPAGSTGLTSAERELVRVHRAEVAYLLRVRAVGLLHERPNSRLHLVHAAPGALPAHATWRRSAEQASRAGALMGDSAGADLLAQCVNSVDADGLSVSDLATASIRLEPTPQARVYVAIDRVLNREPWTGLRVLQGVLARGVSDHLASEVWESIGFAWHEERRLPEALSSYARACELDASRPMPVFHSLVISLQLGDERKFLKLSHQIEDFSEQEPRVRARLEQIRIQRGSGEWSPTEPAAGLRVALRDRVGPATRRILDVFS